MNGRQRICLFVHSGMNVCLCVCECLWRLCRRRFVFFRKNLCRGLVGGSAGGYNWGWEVVTPAFTLLMLTCSKRSVYNLLPTTCTVGGKKTSFQEERQEAENQPPSKSYQRLNRSQPKKCCAAISDFTLFSDRWRRKMRGVRHKERGVEWESQ